MATTERQQHGTSPVPTRIYMRVRDLPAADARYLAETAVEMAKLMAPKATGESASKFSPIWGEGYFGIAFSDAHVWYQEMGIRPFTMNNLAGKTIPMWVDDPDGKLRSENPRAEVKQLPGGRVQVLIFRKVAQKGARRKVVRNVRGIEQYVDVPASYPGAPGRIASREAAQPWTTEGRVGGAIARRNVGVRWRHPGMFGKYFLREGLRRSAIHHGITPGTVMFASEGVRARRQPLAAVKETPNPAVRGAR
jgi:hypothetical protein